MFARSRSSRPAFTLIELLVVIAIIGVLVALLLPAVQAAREAGRRASCSNNLKQQALALHNYHDIYNSFPPGNRNCRNWPDCSSNSYNYGGPHMTTWTIAILAFMEQAPLFQKYEDISPTDRNNVAANKELVQTIIPSYLCPSDINTRRREVPESGPRPFEYAPGSYRAVSGLSRGRGGSGTHFDEGNSLDPLDRGAMHVVYGDKWIEENMAAVSDGLSNTLMIGEYHTRTHNTRRTFWGYGYTSYNESSITAGSPNAYGIPDYDCCNGNSTRSQCDNLNNNVHDCKRAFGSFHPSGINFAMADGSVQFIENTIDIQILGDAATIGGQEIGLLLAK